MSGPQANILRKVLILYWFLHFPSSVSGMPNHWLLLSTEAAPQGRSYWFADSSRQTPWTKRAEEQRRVRWAINKGRFQLDVRKTFLKGRGVSSLFLGAFKKSSMTSQASVMSWVGGCPRWSLQPLRAQVPSFLCHDRFWAPWEPCGSTTVGL